MASSFSNLGSYFVEVEHFNQRIIDADISDDQLQSYENELASLRPLVERALKDVLDDAFRITAMDTAEKALRLGLDLLGAVNPVKWLSGENSFKEIIDSTSELAQASAGHDKIKKITDAAKELYQRSIDVSKGFKENKLYLSNVQAIIYRGDNDNDEAFEKAKEDFLNSYGNYNPSVTRPQITELATYWEAMLSSACDVVSDTSSALGATLKADAYIECMKTNILIAKMVELYSEIYDFQFDLLNSLTASMRSQNAIKAAQTLKQEFESISNQLDPNQDTTVTTLVMIGGLNHVIYKEYILQAVILYCNFLEYKDDSSILQSICKGPATNLPLLMRFEPSPCSLEVHKFYGGVPTKPSSTNDEAYMDITKLYTGEPVYFKIPNSQWLVDRGWIFPSQRDDVIFVRQFEVYLPTTSNPDRGVLVRAMPLANEKIPNGIIYDIGPQPSLQFHYTEGASAGAYCRRHSDPHPYTSCMSNPDSSICYNTIDVVNDDLTAYPSIYARWNITVEGYEHVVPPTPANDDFTLIVAFSLCKLSPVVSNMEYGTHVYDQSVGGGQECCSDGQYRYMSYIRDSECRVCPGNSVSTLAGYYCDKNSLFRTTINQEDKNK